MIDLLRSFFMTILFTLSVFARNLLSFTASSAVEIAENIAKTSGKPVNSHTVRRSLYQIDYMAEYRVKSPSC